MRRLIGLQYLRGIAALGVVVYHATDRAQAPFGAGKAGVDLFFVLSGFLMWAITDDDSKGSGKAGARRIGPFLSDRVKRIVPSYWVVTSVMLAGALLGLFPAVRLTGWHIASSYLLLPSVSPSNGQVWPLLAPGWTLEYEIAFYLLFAATLGLSRRVQLPVLSLVLLALAALHPLIPQDAVMVRYYSDAHILEFLAGLWLAAAWERGALDPRGASAVLGGAALLWIVALAAVAPDWNDTALYGPPAVLIVGATLAREQQPAGMPDWPPLRLLGDASYSIYLWHTLAISVTAKIAEKMGIEAWAAIPLHVVAGVGVGFAGYALVERPIMAALKRPRYRHGAPVPGGV